MSMAKTRFRRCIGVMRREAYTTFRGAVCVFWLDGLATLGIWHKNAVELDKVQSRMRNQRRLAVDGVKWVEDDLGSRRELNTTSPCQATPKLTTKRHCK